MLSLSTPSSGPCRKTGFSGLAQSRKREADQHGSILISGISATGACCSISVSGKEFLSRAGAQRVLTRLFMKLLSFVSRQPEGTPAACFRPLAFLFRVNNDSTISHGEVPIYFRKSYLRVAVLTGGLMQRIFQLTGWLLLLTIVVLSLVPPSARPVTGASQGFEHLLVFLPAGLSLGLGYPTRQLRGTMGLVVFTGIVELAQMWAPGRHARLSDFMIDALGICIGLAIAGLAARFAFPRMTPPTREIARAKTACRGSRSDIARVSQQSAES
jgi:hypothetical protein